ncbi:MAG: HEAT repeat domain-containing protein [Balneolaceae bacterium]
MIRHCTALLSICVLFLAIAGCSQQEPEPEIRTISDEQAETESLAGSEEISTETPDDLDISIWATKELLGDPIAISMDNQGKAWVTVTNRSRNSEFDIRDVDDSWLIESMKWETVEDRRNFLHEELAPERSDENTWLWDHNEDGEHDWTDLTVLKEEVWQVEDVSGDGRADRSQLYIRDFHDEVTDVAGAVLNHNDEIYIGVGPDMWRTRDTNGDGISDEKESISHGYNVHIGFSGHGMSGATVGPDGRIYWGIGDMGLSVTDQEGDEHHYPNRGAILRSEPDGSNFEVFAAGLRNTHEFVFDKYGNLITVDNDGDHAGEFERLVYLVNGSDSGWRTNWQFGKYTDPKNNEYKVWMDEDYYKPRWDDQAAHLLPPLAEYHAGPAGMAYNPGTALNDNWKDHFFVMSFRGSVTNSPIFAFTLEEEGASYRMTSDQEALTGVLAVGLDFGPDGALYMTDWIEGWGQNDEGRIWKLDDEENANSPERVDTKELLAESFDGTLAEVLIERMGHEDMRVRRKAQFELAARGDAAALEQATEPGNSEFTRIHGIWGLAQIARNEPETAESLVGLLEDETSEIRAQAARWLGDVRYSTAAESIVPLLSDDHPRVRFFAAEALGRMGFEDGFDPIVDMLEENNDEDVYLRQAGAIALSRIDNGERVTELSEHESKAVRIAAIVALKRLEHPGSAQFLNDEDEFVVTNAARAISDDAFVEDAMPALAKLLENLPFDNEPLVRRVINANLYTGGEEEAGRLASFAAEPAHSEAMRVEAIETMKHWDEPSIFDRVTGRHRGQIENEIEDAREAIAGIYNSLLTDSESVQIASIEVLAELGMNEAESELVGLLSDAGSADIRSAALSGLRDLNYGQIDEAIQVALVDPDETVRMAAIGMIPGLDIDEETTVSLLEVAFEENSTPEQQSALLAFGNLDNEYSYSFLEQQLNRLQEGTLPAEIQVELLETVDQLNSEDLKQQVEAYHASKPEDNPVEYYSEALEGGSANEGRTVFYQNPTAQCIRCHAVDESGGEVGPELTSISNELSREQLLESLVAPSARIAPGYGVATLTLSNGETVQGAIEDETDSQWVLTVNEESRTFDKSDVESVTTTPSSMPAMGDQLSLRELRDLVEYMSDLDGTEE